MVDNIKQIKIFIASPSDCILEREAVRSISNDDSTIKKMCRKFNSSFDVFGFEDLCSDIGRPQSIINAAVEKFNPDWFVFIFWHRIGSDAGLGMTGTEEEWNLARQLNEKGGGHPKVSIFFNQESPPPYERDNYQLDDLKRFQGKIFSEYQAYACLFNGTRDFEKKFQTHLADILLHLGEGQGEITIDRLRQEFLMASSVLLNYQRTLGDNQQIDRIEFESIIKHIEESEQSTTMLLGCPGSGKSSLLSAITHNLHEKSMLVLAIKADTLSNSIKTVEDLHRELNLDIGIKDSVLALAQREKVIVIIDQLDAVSELLDRKSGRLNVLLSLIQELSGQKGVHIIASSREFEYRYDVRLNSIEAERVVLELPKWEQIAIILEQAGYETVTMNDELKELLRIPLHLKIFLDIAKPGAIFRSLHALLEELWKQRVLVTHAPENCFLLLYNLAMRMAEEESLWLPSACADSYMKACRFLEQNDILVRGQDGLTIGFRHQTYYDYTLTRAFTSGSDPLADYVFQRQNGLFIRPTFLSCLHYMRTVSPPEYHKQLKIFFITDLRPHLNSLLIEFLGSQKDPDDIEAYLLLPLLKNDKEGPKVLSAVAGSPGWFNRIKRCEGLEIWMSKPIESAAHCVPFLIAAIDFAAMDVFNLMMEYWFNDVNYDSLMLNVFLDFKDWELDTVLVAEKLVARSNHWIAWRLVERIAEINPELAPRVLRAYLDEKLASTIIEMESRKADKNISLQKDGQNSIRELYQHDKLENLIKNHNGYIDYERMAEDAPKSFLQYIWPWFLKIIKLASLEEHKFLLQYRSDTIINGWIVKEPEETVVTGLLVAIENFAKNDTQAFLQFLDENASLDLLTVHCFLVHGLAQIVSVEPKRVLEYLLEDQRRLCIDTYNDCYKGTKQLVAEVFPHISQNDRLRLEEAVLSFNRYKKVDAGWDIEERRSRMASKRRHRLRLLRAFPKEYLSFKIKKVIEEEERVFPGLTDYNGVVSGGFVGPRIKSDEMMKASDQELINLFNQLPDKTQWDNPNRRGEDCTRGGGSIQQSREFSEMAKKYPFRVVGIINNLKPDQHETYVGAGLEGLAESNLPFNELINLIKELDKKGFSSGHFREGAASAIEKLTDREDGLSDEILLLLEKWMAEHTEPEWPQKDEHEEKKNEDIKHSILFSMRGIFVLPHGRGTILRAIAAGYLKRQQPDYNNWARIIMSRIGCEQHPDVWALTMMHMPVLFNGNPEDATQIYDSVIQTCPLGLYEKQVALHSIARVMPRCCPIEVLQGWLDKIKAFASDFNSQAYGEMLFLYYYHYQDSWSSDCIMRILLNSNDRNLLLGLAYGASYFWYKLKNRNLATEILCKLASHSDKSIQYAVASVFRYNRDYLILNSDMKKIINVVCDNHSLLLEAAADIVELLVEYTVIEPKLVSEVCEELIRVGGSDIGDIRTSLVLLAEPLTNIALTLHRLDEYREVGLQMFEELISLNIRETRAALDVLDRKPVKTLISPLKSRRRRKKRF